MPRTTTYTYDPVTGTWVAHTSDVEDKKTNDDTSSNTTTNGENLVSSDTDADSSVGATEKEYNYIELNTLSGQLAFIATEDNLKLKAGDTVKLSGLGKYLSGYYYVKDITRTFNSSGYSHSATVIKTDFGDRIKLATNIHGNKNSSSSSKQKTKVSSSLPPNTTPQRIYIVQKGDTLWSIARQHYGSGSRYTDILDASTGKFTNTIKVGQKLIIS